jgi:cell division protein FtsL
MSTIAQTARVRPKARTRVRPKPTLLGGGVFWIVFFAMLLAGVVAVNVAVLRLNVQLDGVGRERGELKADIAGLRAELSSASATARIERLARNELGYEPANPETMVYVELGPR